MSIAQESPIMHEPPESLCHVVQRMYGITGFVSVLTEPGDDRTQVFCRYYHVRRVAWLSHYIAQLHREGPGDLDILNWFAWAHDLNRWPFAHNSERGLFNQAADLPRYLQAESIEVPNELIIQLMAIVDKEYNLLGREASIVLLADIATGFLEDPIWLLAALNVSPAVVPDKVAAYLGLPLDDKKFLAQMLSTLQSFQSGVCANDFVAYFDQVFAQLARSFVHKEFLTADGCDAYGILRSASFVDIRNMIKEQFMRCVIFPYNNVKISKGPLLKNKVVLPLLDKLLPEPAARMTRMTDASLIQEALKYSVIIESDLSLLRPNLEYMEQEEPENSFTTYMRANL